jgi:hypothetical protein
MKRLAEFKTPSGAQVVINELSRKLRVRWKSGKVKKNYLCTDWDAIYKAIEDAEGKMNRPLRDAVDNVYYAIKADTDIETDLDDWLCGLAI